MATDHIAAIRELSWEGLRALWARIAARRTAPWPRGKAFEHLVLRAFELEGAEVRWPFRVSYASGTLEELDGVVYANGLAVLIETKDNRDPVDASPVVKLHGALRRRPASVFGVVFSTNGFTSPAQEQARASAPHMVLLWEGSEVDDLLRRAHDTKRPQRHFVDALQTKWRFSVEQGSPYFDTRTLRLPG